MGREDLLFTPRQEALFKLLSESGATEDGTDADGRPFKDAPPNGMATMLDMTLDSYPNEDQLVEILCWGDSRFREQARPLARKSIELIDEHRTSPA